MEQRLLFMKKSDTQNFETFLKRCKMSGKKVQKRLSASRETPRMALKPLGVDSLLNFGPTDAGIGPRQAPLCTVGSLTG